MNDSVIIPLNAENTFFKILKIEVCPKSKEITGKMSFNPITISCKINDAESSYRIEQLLELSNQSFTHYDQIVDVNKVMSNSAGNKSIEFTYTCTESFECEVRLYYTTTNKRVDLKNPYESFSEHLKLHDNVKILFSAPFGQGKTTFLDDFFDKNFTNYEVFKLYPVNYAVSHNEDIFKYIKAEILFQLMNKEVEFDKIEFNYSETAYSYFSQNIDKILSPLITLLPKIGETAGKVFDKIFELAQVLKKYKSALNIDDKKSALKYIHELYEKEGSIFEDNFYTQLIRQLLQQHHQNTKKQNVLIIDDIDRMDPDHIFRIFNVFSANFDSLEYSHGLSNKFGFDKIILVCDYSNIKKLFIHRYGNDYSFEGYLSKYYSRSPYTYDNLRAIESITKELTYYDGNPIDSIIGNALILIINDLVYSEEITLRDLIKLLKNNFYKTLDKQIKINHTSLPTHMGNYMYFNIFAFLKNIFDAEAILYKLRKCKRKAPFRNRVNYTYYTSNGFVAFINEQIDPSKIYDFIFKSQIFKYKVSYTRDFSLNFDCYQAENITSTSNDTVKFNEKDFYEILIQNAEKFSEL